MKTDDPLTRVHVDDRARVPHRPAACRPCGARGGVPAGAARVAVPAEGTSCDGIAAVPTVVRVDVEDRGRAVVVRGVDDAPAVDGAAVARVRVPAERVRVGRALCEAAVCDVVRCPGRGVDKRKRERTYPTPPPPTSPDNPEAELPPEASESAAFCQSARGPIL